MAYLKRILDRAVEAEHFLGVKYTISQFLCTYFRNESTPTSGLLTSTKTISHKIPYHNVLETLQASNSEMLRFS